MLTGYRVLDITQFVAGPTCTRILAELGAEVIKIELAPSGDRGRASGDRSRDPTFKAGSQSTYFFQHNHSKKSVAVDIKQPRGRELVRALVPKVDIVVENFAPGVMARAGLGYDDLKALHPGLIMCSISLAGQSGPLSQKPGFDYIGAAYAGITASMGEADRGPTQLTTAVGDSATGMTAAMSIAVALLHRERRRRAIHRVLAGRHLFQHAPGGRPEVVAARALVRPETGGLAASRRRPDRKLPLPRR
jgi:CoA:oxalate CoA-transferase